MTRPGEFVAGYIVTATDMNDLPGGVLDYAQITASQTNFTTEADITGLSVTVDVVANRRIRIEASVLIRQETSGATPSVFIKEGSTYLQRFQASLDANARTVAQVSTVITPSAGSHTYKLTATTEAGDVDVLADSSTLGPSHILVEDIGPA